MGIIELKSERLLVASDIHGDWESYSKIKERFSRLKRKGLVDALVFEGDLVHSTSGKKDDSLRILDNLIDSHDKSVISLLGNHELVHIYHLDVSFGDESLGKELEEKIAGKRERYVKFMKSMPYAIRTLGGVTINHSGASLVNHRNHKGHYASMARGVEFLDFMKNLDHDKILKKISDSERPDMKHNPEIGKRFFDSELGDYFWQLLFNRNEKEYEPWVYNLMLEGFLEDISKDGFKQRFLISGHIGTPDGFKVIEKKQLRIGVSHAKREERYLARVDARRNYENIGELVQDLEILR